MHQHAHSCLVCGPSIHYTDNYSLSVPYTMPAIVLGAVPPSTIPTVVLCRCLHSIHLLILTPRLVRHHTGASNLKRVFFIVCSDMYHPRSSSNSLRWVRSTVSRFLSTTHGMKDFTEFPFQILKLSSTKNKIKD